MRKVLALLEITAILLVGCSNPPGIATPGSGDANLHLYVSNQSFDVPTVDLLVTIDGVTLFDDEARVEQQHNWMLRETTLAPGTHRIDALERGSGTQANGEFTLPPGEHRWVVVNYWNPSEDGGPEFTISSQPEQVMFD